MARVIYACRFEVPTSSGLTVVTSAYSSWISSHYRNRRKLPSFSLDIADTVAPVPEVPEGHFLSLENFVGTKGQARRINWSYPSDTDEGLAWRNEIRLGAFGDRCSVEHLVSIDSTEYRVAPAKFALGSPSVIRQLCADAAVQVGDMQVKATAYPVTSESVQDFLKLLASPFRRLPIVLVSPYASGAPSALDVASLALNLAGVGIVVTALDAEATWDIAEQIGRRLSCFDGAARIYWPGFSTDHDPRAHRLFLGARVEEVGAAAVARYIERSIFAVAAFRFVPDARIDEVILETQQAERIHRVEQQKTQAGYNWENIALELDAELQKANESIANLRSENKNLKDNQQVFLSSRMDGETDEVDGPGDDVATPVDSVESAVEYARQNFPNLIILPSALDSAKNSPFQRPDEIVSALRDLDEIAVVSAEQKKVRGSGGDILQHLKTRGWGKRSSMHISNTSRTTYRSDYEFEYGGRRQLFEPHITLGSGAPNSCASIHFLLDQGSGKIVVAHVGRHLTNTKS